MIELQDLWYYCACGCQQMSLREWTASLWPSIDRWVPPWVEIEEESAYWYSIRLLRYPTWCTVHQFPERQRQDHAGSLILILTEPTHQNVLLNPSCFIIPSLPCISLTLFNWTAGGSRRLSWGEGSRVSLRRIFLGESFTCTSWGLDVRATGSTILGSPGELTDMGLVE